jgi:hypothetical protein
MNGGIRGIRIYEMGSVPNNIRDRACFPVFHKHFINNLEIGLESKMETSWRESTKLDMETGKLLSIILLVDLPSRT